MIYRHFFWDFDGTLYDTYGRVTRAAVKGMQDLGIAVSFEAAFPQCKRTLDHCARVFAVPRGFSVDEFMAAYRRHAEEEGDESIRPYAGVRELLSAVVRAGGKNYLYTHRDHVALDRLRMDGLDGFFTDAVTSEMGFPRKPAPDALKHLVQKYGLALADCVMLGDRDIDLDSGKNAGMACALFDPDGFYEDYDTPWRFRDMDTLRRTLVGD